MVVNNDLNGRYITWKQLFVIFCTSLLVPILAFALAFGVLSSDVKANEKSIVEHKNLQVHPNAGERLSAIETNIKIILGILQDE